MNVLENFASMMNHGRGGPHPQWLPFDLPITPPIADRIEARHGTRDAAVAYDLDFCQCGPQLSDDSEQWRNAYAAAGISLPPGAEVMPLGAVFVPPSQVRADGAYHLREIFNPLSSLATIEQMRALPWPDLDTALSDETLVKDVAAIRAAGKVSVCSLECTVFESAWKRRGMDVLFEDLIEENEIGAWLLDWFTEYAVRRARLAARAGVDVVGLGDDVGTQRGMMMSVQFWRDHFKPRLKQVIDTLRENQTRPLWIRYHSDGDIRPIIDDLVEIGVDILNPVQPECLPVAEVITEHKHHLKFWGMVGTQTTMPFGTPDEVRAAVAECAQLARDGAGIVVSPTHVLEPDVPLENIEAFIDAVRKERF